MSGGQPPLLPERAHPTRVLSEVHTDEMSLAEARRLADDALARREKTKCLCCGRALKIGVVKLGKDALSLAIDIVDRSVALQEPVQTPILRGKVNRDHLSAWGLIQHVSEGFGGYVKGELYDDFLAGRCALPEALYYFDGRLVGRAATTVVFRQLRAE